LTFSVLHAKIDFQIEEAVSHSVVLLSYVMCGLGDRAQPQAGNPSPQAGSLSPQAGSLSHQAGNPQAGSLSPQAGRLSPQAGSLSHFNPNCIGVYTGFFWQIPSKEA
jgi:hypothetical protein